MTANNKQRTCDDYHVAWICAVSDLELDPARLMLDDHSEHRTPPYDTHYDENRYICGSINGHAIVIASCPPGETGNVNSGRLTGSMFKTFRNIRITVLVGIGGGIPGPIVSEDSLENIHLGDVVVGWPADGKPACVYHDRGRSKINGQFDMVGTIQDPNWRLTSALGVLASDHELGRTTFGDQLARLQRYKKKWKFAHPGLEHDKLFKSVYHHVGDYTSKCIACCDQSELVQRPPRTEEHKQTLVFHRGRIATGNAVIQDGVQRDQIGARCDGALCVEMEAAGVAANRPCLVVRGISDYADSHKSDLWRSHAAGKAAAFTRELLCRVQLGHDRTFPDSLRDLDAPHIELRDDQQQISKKECRAELDHIVEFFAPEFLPDDVLREVQSLASRDPTQMTKYCPNVKKSLHVWSLHERSSVLVFQADICAQNQSRAFAAHEIRNLLSKGIQSVSWSLSPIRALVHTASVECVLKSIIYQLLQNARDVSAGLTEILKLSEIQNYHSVEEWINLISLLISKNHRTTYLVVETGDLYRVHGHGSQWTKYLLGLFQAIIGQCEASGGRAQVLLIVYGDINEAKTHIDKAENMFLVSFP